MTKIKYLVAVLVVTMMLMGAGYAAISNNITITGTATAGDFGVTIKQTSFEITNTDNTANNKAVAQVSAVTNTAGTYNNQTGTITLTNLYPGASAKVTYKLGGVGSVPAKYDKMSFVATDGQHLLGNLEFRFNHTANNDQKWSTWMNYSQFTSYIASSIPTVHQKTMEKGWEDIMAIEIRVIDAGSEIDQNDIQNETVNFSLEWDFKAFNK